MKALKYSLLLILASLCLCGRASAWDCTSPGQIRVQVPAGTKGTGTGDGPGEVVTVEGITFQCQNPPKTPTKTKGAPITATNTNTNTNSNSNNNSNSNTNNNNNSSKSTSSSNSSSNQNQGQSQGQGQTQTATGGNASATGGAGGAGGQGGQGGSSNQSQSSISSATDNGDGSNNTTTNTNVAAPKIPVSTAYAPSVAPTVTCFKGAGVGVQTMAFGGSFGAGRIDENCAVLEAARQARNLLGFCKVWITNKYVHRAGVTLEDCMSNPPVDIPTPVAVPTPIVVNVPAPVETPKVVVPTPEVKVTPPPVVVTAVPDEELVGICTFASQLQCSLTGAPTPQPTRVTSVCDEMLAAVAKVLNDNPNARLDLVGNVDGNERGQNTMYALARANNVKAKLVRAGVSADRIHITTGSDNKRTVELWLIR